jgi:hypothetical protein
MATTKDQLNRYFAMIDRRVPTRVSQFIRWLRKPSSFAVRLVVALLLIVGGFFSFLPILSVDAASWPAVHCARCALVAKTLSQSVNVG